MAEFSITNAIKQIAGAKRLEEWRTAHPRLAWALDRVSDEAQRLLLTNEIMRKGHLTEQSTQYIWDLAAKLEQEGQHDPEQD